MEQVTIQYSGGRGARGQLFAYIRPSGRCNNRSRRVAVTKIQDTVSKFYPVVNYYLINGSVIGAKNEAFALKEFYRICSKENIGKPFLVKQIID